MKTLQYYDELEKAVKVPSSISLYFDEKDDDLPNEVNMYRSVLVEVVIPFIRWNIFVVTHEEIAFKRIISNCEDEKNDNRRISPMELFGCLRSLSDENRRLLLGQLKDVPDRVINKLSKSAEEDNFDEFSNVIDETEVNTSQITTICMEILSLIDFQSTLEQFYNDLIQAFQIDKEEESFRQIEKVFNLFFSNLQAITNDNSFVNLCVEKTNNTIEELTTNEEPSDYFRNNTISTYHSCIKYYIECDQEEIANRMEMQILEDIVFNPKYKEFWKDYVDVEDAEEIENAQSSPQKEEPLSLENDRSICEYSTWRLPNEFFDKSYIDDCDINEYIPFFLEDQIKIAAVVNDKLTELKKRLNVVFQDFIETLAGKGCIDNDYLTKASFAHALTGRKVDVEIKKVKWKYSQSAKDKGWLNNICFIASKLYPRYIYDKNHNQLKKFDHIKKVFDLDYGSLTPELYQKINPEKIGSSYGDNADDFVKNAVEKFLNSVEFIKISIGA